MKPSEQDVLDVLAQMENVSLSRVQALGIVQEVNRLLLHPRGMMMVPVPQENGDAVFVLAVTSDPEGMCFDGVGIDPDPLLVMKARAFHGLLLPARKARFGSLIQPLPGFDG